LLAFNGAGPAPCADRDEAGIDLSAGKRPLSSRPQANVQAIRAEYLGATTCTAAGITARASAPVLALCRELLAAGLDPDQAMEVFRGATLALRMRSIGEAAELAVKDDNRGTPRFVRHRPGPDERAKIACGKAPLMRQNGKGGAS
jgi:hypothetical protein